MASEEDAHAHDHDHAHDDGPPGDIDPEPYAMRGLLKSILLPHLLGRLSLCTRA